MIKAISRHILEVSETGNACFERAWLMVSPEYCGAGSGELEREAEGYLCGLDAPGAFKSRIRAPFRIFRFLFAAACGGLVTAAVMTIR